MTSAIPAGVNLHPQVGIHKIPLFFFTLHKAEAERLSITHRIQDLKCSHIGYLGHNAQAQLGKRRWTLSNGCCKLGIMPERILYNSNPARRATDINHHISGLLIETSTLLHRPCGYSRHFGGRVI